MSTARLLRAEVQKGGDVVAPAALARVRLEYSSEGRGSSICRSTKPVPMMVLTYSESVRSKRGTAKRGASADASVKRQPSIHRAGLKYSLTTQLTFSPASL